MQTLIIFLWIPGNPDKDTSSEMNEAKELAAQISFKVLDKEFAFSEIILFCTVNV